MERLVGMGHGGAGNAAIHTGGDDGGKGEGDREGVHKNARDSFSARTQGETSEGVAEQLDVLAKMLVE